MAYVITTQKGKDIAKGMKSGESWTNTADGSTWTKQSDGSVSVTHNGQTFNNAYTPTSSGGSSGGSKGGNSQYTGSSNSVSVSNNIQQSIKDQMNANSIAWWSADEAGKKQLEATNKMLAGYLGQGVSYDSATGTWSGSADKIYFTNPSDIAGWNDTYNQNNEKPTAPQRDPRIDALLNQILTRDKFSYDAASDPLYQQYAQMYQREGDRAMKETLAEAAAGAGGMNTYAITAAQQANSYHNSQLNDRIPELYQLAYNMYLQDIEGQVRDLGLLENMDATQYSRYRDTMNDWYNDKNFAYGTFQDAVQQGNWQTNFDYNDLWKNKEFNYNDMWANKEWDYNDEWKNKEWNTAQEDKDYERNQYDQESAKAEVWKYIELGVTPSADLIKKAGMTETDVNLAVAAVKAEQARKSASTSYSGYTGGDKNKDEKKDEKKDDDLGYNPTKDTGEDEEDKGDGSVIGLGIGPVSDDLLEKLAKAGAVVGDENGNLYWADGWSRTNYEKRLQDFSGWSNFLTLPML